MKFPPSALTTCPMAASRDSGIGREGLCYAIEDMTEPKLLVMNLRRP